MLSVLFAAPDCNGECRDGRDLVLAEG